MKSIYLYSCMLIIMNTIGLTSVYSFPSTDNESALSFRVKSLADFAQLYGHIRFFHPSDEAQQIEWTRFVVHGVSKVKSQTDRGAVKRELETLFSPVAPTVQWFSSPHPPSRSTPYSSCSPDLIMSWQHLGLRLFDHSRYRYEMPYESKRLNSNDSKASKVPLFESRVKSNEVVDLSLRQGFSARIPLTVCRVEQSKHSKEAVNRLKDHLNLLTKDKLNTDSEDVRIANIIIAWTELRHFFPYFDEIKVNWDQQLEVSLAEVLRDQNAKEYFDTLRQMLALLEDGHIFVPNPPIKLGYLPIRVGVFDDEVVVIGSESPLFRRGDVIERFAQETGMDHLRRQESYVSASPHLKRRRALNLFGSGIYGQSVEIKLRRGNKHISLSHKLKHMNGRNQMFNTVNDFDFPDIKELSPGVFYINGASTNVKTYQARLHEIAQARGVIFDLRWDGKLSPYLGSMDSLEHIVGHIAGPDKGYTIPHANDIPQVIRPDRKALTFDRSIGPDPSAAPKIKGEVVLILDHALMSAYESSMAIVSHYKLATTVGEDTGGCNGNSNYIFLADGTQIPYTGMRVTKLDGSQLYLKGFEPDVPVKQTRAGMIAGKDEVLAKAIEVLNKKIQRSQP